MNVLLAGFEPFGGSDVNPSGQAARDLDGLNVEGAVVRGVVLPVSRNRTLPVLIRFFNETNPVCVVMSGQSGRPPVTAQHEPAYHQPGTKDRGTENRGVFAVSGRQYAREEAGRTAWHTLYPA